MDSSNDTVTLRAKHRDEEGKVVVDKIPVHAHDVDTLKHFEKKLVDTGLHRHERHSGKVGSVKKPPPKKGHGGKYTWEGPDPEAENELEAEPALDKGDPNYVDDEVEEVVDDDVEEVKERIKGEVEVANVYEDKEGVARVEVDPNLK